jgi:hypothetical protein
VVSARDEVGNPLSTQVGEVRQRCASAGDDQQACLRVSLVVQATLPRPSTTANHFGLRWGRKSCHSSSGSVRVSGRSSGLASSATNVPLPSSTTIGWWRCSMAALRCASRVSASGGQALRHRRFGPSSSSRSERVSVTRPSAVAVTETMTRGRAVSPGRGGRFAVTAGR